MAMTNHFEFFTDLRGFRVYSNTVNWKPCKGQKVVFKGENKNPYNKFAITRKNLLKGKTGLLLVMFQKSYHTKFGMPFKREQYLKLKYIM